MKSYLRQIYSFAGSWFEIFDEEKRSVDQKVDETDPTSIFEQSREHLSPGFEM